MKTAIQFKQVLALVSLLVSSVYTASLLTGCQTVSDLQSSDPAQVAVALDRLERKGAETASVFLAIFPEQADDFRDVVSGLSAITLDGRLSPADVLPLISQFTEPSEDLQRYFLGGMLVLNLAFDESPGLAGKYVDAFAALVAGMQAGSQTVSPVAVRGFGRLEDDFTRSAHDELHREAVAKGVRE